MYVPLCVCSTVCMAYCVFGPLYVWSIRTTVYMYVYVYGPLYMAHCIWSTLCVCMVYTTVRMCMTHCVWPTSCIHKVHWYHGSAQCHISPLVIIYEIFILLCDIHMKYCTQNTHMIYVCRLYPIITNNRRMLDKDVIMDGYKIPKGVRLMVYVDFVM